jgi:uncharacterized protein YjbI with pentapeptide repeats
MINRIGTRTGFESMMGLNQQTLQRTYNLQIQISSGLKAQNYSGISDVSGRLVNFEGANLQGANFDRANLQSVNFERANLLEVQNFRFIIPQTLNLNELELFFNTFPYSSTFVNLLQYLDSIRVWDYGPFYPV